MFLYDYIRKFYSENYKNKKEIEMVEKGIVNNVSILDTHTYVKDVVKNLKVDKNINNIVAENVALL